MNRRLSLLLTVCIFLFTYCTTTPTPTNQPPGNLTPKGIPKDKNEAKVKGKDGIKNIPVRCGSQQGDINIPAGSFSGEETITIECLSKAEQKKLDQEVEAHTGKTGEVLGAIKLNPSGMKFDANVIITIPLIREVLAQYVQVYIYDEEEGDFFEKIPNAKVECTGWCAKAKYNHFTTFIAYETEQAADFEGPQIVDISREPASNWACLEEIDGMAIYSTIIDPSGVDNALVEYQFNEEGWRTLNMDGAAEAFTANLRDLKEGFLNLRISATDQRGNSSTVETQSISLFQCAGLLPRQDLPGLDLPDTGASVGANNLQACRENCVNNSECAAFTFYPEDGACWLKSGEPQAADNVDLISGVVRSDEEPPTILDITLTQLSHKLSEIGGALCTQYQSPLEVSPAIRDNSGVSRANLSYRFTPFSGKMVQESIPMRQDGDFFTVAIDIPAGGELSYSIEAWDTHENRAETDPAQITYWDCTELLFNTDLPGLDFPETGTSLEVNNPQACRQNCEGRSDCMAFTYRPADQACWLKQGQPNPADAQGLISGVVRPDGQGPVISGVEAIKDYCESSHAIVRATVMDPSQVKGVSLWTNTNGVWNSTPMYFNPQTQQYEADLFMPPIGLVWYYVEALDTRFNISQTKNMSIQHVIC